VKTGLAGHCENWAWGLVCKLGLRANVETGLEGQYENWAWGLVWELGLRARQNWA